jgi:hypothetical protein
MDDDICPRCGNCSVWQRGKRSSEDDYECGSCNIAQHQRIRLACDRGRCRNPPQSRAYKSMEEAYDRGAIALARCRRMSRSP